MTCACERHLPLTLLGLFPIIAPTCFMRIDRCYCFQKTFAKLKEVADATGASSVSQLQENIPFGENCELCHPYVREMLYTGQTTFRETIEASEEKAGENGG